MFKRAQTATEYLIILAVVIIIALVVVGVLGGIPGIGGGTSGRTSQAQLSTADVGIISHAVTNTNTSLTLRNNHAETIVVTNVSFDGEVDTSCTGIPLTLQIGQDRDVTCPDTNTTTGEPYEYEVSIDYTRGGVSYSVVPGSIGGNAGS